MSEDKDRVTVDGIWTDKRGEVYCIEFRGRFYVTCEFAQAIASSDERISTIFFLKGIGKSDD